MLPAPGEDVAGGEVSGMRCLLFSICCVLFCAPPTFACVNDDGTLESRASSPPKTLPDFIVSQNWSQPVISLLIDLVIYQQRDWPALRADFEKVRQDGSIQGPSLDNAYAITLMRLGEAKKAVKVLERLERSHPGLYNTAANLGTAYELSGDLWKARTWIKKGIERNPKSHDGTEWLHVGILDARLSLVKDPDWLAENSVLGLDFGENPTPTTPEGIDYEKTMKALKYQLRERISFVDPTDPIVADLLFDLANLTALKGAPDEAAAVLRLARLYNPNMHRPLDKRLEFFEFLAKEKTGTKED